MSTEGWILSLLVALPGLARVAGIVACAAPFAAAGVPRRVRIMLAIALAMGLSSTAGTATLPSTLGGTMLAVGGELMIGIAIGLGVNLLFVAAQWVGEIAAGQLGLNLSETFDPSSAEGRNALGHGYWLLTVVIFLGINGHHALVRGIRSSFETMPLYTIANSSALLDTFVRLLGTVTSLAVRLALPVFVTMLIVDLAVGMVGRTVPQMGLMTAGVTVRALVGLVVLVLGMALAVTVLQGASAGWISLVLGR